MIILTDKMLVIPVGISPNYSGVNKPSLEDKSVEITANGDYSYTASEAYYGIGNFNVKVNVATVEGHYESGKTVNPSFVEDITVLPSEGFDAMSSVIVKKAEANLQDKTVDKASESQIVLTADEGYQGLGTVTIAPIHLRSETITPTSGDQILVPDTDSNEYIDFIYVNGVPERTLTVDPSILNQEFNSNHLDGEFYSRVVVHPVTSSIDSNIVPKNIAKGVRILGVTGTLDTSSGDAPLPSELQEIINKGPAYSSKIKVYGVYTKDKSTAYDVRSDNFNDGGGVNGYIPFFQKNVKYDNGYPSNDTLANSLGTLADRGIVAYTVNGVLYTNPTSFNIPYRKVKFGSNFYDDVTVDVYIDFTKANARAEIIENAFLSDNGITTPVDPSLFDVNTYRYLPPIYNSNKNEYYFRSNNRIFEFVETYVREQVNALSALFISGGGFYSYSDYAGEITFLTGKDGIKRVPDALSQRDFTNFSDLTFYGNVNDFKNLQYWFNQYQNFYVYGNVKGYDGIFMEQSTYFFGNVSTPTSYFKSYSGNFLDKNNDILDIGENIDTNPLIWNGLTMPFTTCNVVLFPNTLKYLYDNYKPYSKYSLYYRRRKIYVFFGTTPPTMPDVDGNPQLLLQTGTTNISENYLTTIYKPAGADYSSILDPTNPPTVIDFTPITSTTEVTGPGIYGLTYGYNGYHWLFEIKESAQGEQELQTIANELNNL